MDAASPANGPRRLRIVVPCFDEARRLRPPEILSALERFPSLSLLFVDDGSRDATLEVLERARGSAPPSRLEVLRLPRNVGKGEAVRAGLLAAFDRPPAPDVLGWFDADLATPLEAAFEMAAALERDRHLLLVLGSRLRTPGSDIRRHLWRHLPGRFLAERISRTLDLPFHDTQCGAKVFRATAAMREVLGEPFLTRWLFDVEILTRLARLHRLGRLPPLSVVVREHPLGRWTDVPGSKVSALDFVRAWRALGRIRRAYG